MAAHEAPGAGAGCPFKLSQQPSPRGPGGSVFPAGVSRGGLALPWSRALPAPQGAGACWHSPQPGARLVGSRCRAPSRDPPRQSAPAPAGLGRSHGSGCLPPMSQHPDPLSSSAEDAKRVARSSGSIQPWHPATLSLCPFLERPPHAWRPPVQPSPGLQQLPSEWQVLG